ncbi:MAG TPA: crossover junction endodeoxyribonuclease RuvC [Candidatus Paceibacterota bacterium]|nr:crossover junction endodeoxyribonuclease RuvC [Candidatus Paceibacterota bacterium]
MISLGIDPGTRRIGYGIVRRDREDPNPRFIAAGILKIASTDDPGALVETKKGMDALFRKYRPDTVAVERLYFAKNQKTAIAVAQARGVILLSARESRTGIREYTPNEVKLGISGYGFADKQAMLKMVRLILAKPGLKLIDDASDALALAIMGSSAY